MSFDAEKYLTESDAFTSISAVLNAAYQQGIKDGIARIAAMAQAPLADNGGDDGVVPDVMQIGSVETHAAVRLRTRPIRRAPRGLVPKIVSRMLAEHPGKIISEYEKLLPEYDTQVSDKSVGNQLRRHEGKLYRRNDNSEWFLIDKNEAADNPNKESSAASYHTNREGGDFHATLNP